MEKTTYATKEQAIRLGNAEAAKLTARGCPTHLVEVREVEVTTVSKSMPVNASLKDWESIVTTDKRWVAILSE